MFVQIEKMNLRENIPRPFILIFLLLLLLILGCSTSSWFSSRNAKMKELLDKEVVIIDKEEYVKVLNPKDSDGKDQPKYLYVPVQEYLSHKESFNASTTTAIEAVKKESASTPTKPSSCIIRGRDARGISVEIGASTLEEEGVNHLF